MRKELCSILFGKSVGLNWIYSRNILICSSVFPPCFYLIFMESLYPVFPSNTTPKNEVRIVRMCYLLWHTSFGSRQGGTKYCHIFLWMQYLIHAAFDAAVQRSLLFIWEEIGELSWCEDREKIMCHIDCYMWGFDSGSIRYLQNLDMRYRNPENPARYIRGFYVYFESSCSWDCIYSTCFCHKVSGVSSC